MCAGWFPVGRRQEARGTARAITDAMWPRTRRRVLAVARNWCRLLTCSVTRSVQEAEAEAVLAEAQGEAAAARVAGRVEARAVGLEPEAEAEAEPGEPEERRAAGLAAMGAPAGQRG